MNFTNLTNAQLIAMYASAIVTSHKMGAAWATDCNNKELLRVFEIQTEETEKVRQELLARMK